MNAVSETPTASRRDELLGIAVKLFAERGVSNTTVRDIAEAAGILSGSLYHHFDSKNQMVAEAVGGGLNSHLAANRAVIEASPNCAVAMAKLIIGAVRWVGADPDVAKILTNDKAYIAANPDLLDTESRRQANLLPWIELIEAGVAEGVFRQVGCSDLLVKTMMDGIFGSARWMYGERPPKEVATEIAAFYLGGLLAPGYTYDFAAGELLTP